VKYLICYEKLKADTAGEIGDFCTHVSWEATPRSIANAMKDSSSKKLRGGRKEGPVDIRSHYRKGLIGDWSNYFDAAVKNRITK